MFYLIGFMSICSMIMANVKYSERNLQKINNKLTQTNLILLFLAAVFIVIFALESPLSNRDLQSYENSYFRNADRSISYYFENWSDLKDPFYHLCGTVFSKLGFSFGAWHAMLGFLFVLSVYTLIKRYSTNIYISFLVFLSLGLFNFCLSGIRQGAALAIIIFSFKFLYEKKLVKFILTVVFASLFHSSALIFVVAYFIYHMRLNIRNLIILAVGGVFVILNAQSIANIYVRFVGIEERVSNYFESDTNLTISGVIISGAILVFCLVFLYSARGSVRYAKICNLLVTAFFIQILSVLWFAEFFRISMYFSAFQCLAIAEACSNTKFGLSFSRIKIFGVSSVLALYYFISPGGNIVNYIFK